MSIHAKIEAILYAAEEPVTAEQVLIVLHEAGLVEELMKPESAPVAEAQVDFSSDEAIAEATASDSSSDSTLVETLPPPKPVKSVKSKDEAKAERAAQRARVKEIIAQIAERYQHDDRGMEVRAVAGGWRITTKAEHHDVVRSFAKSLKPPVRLSLPALETLAVIAYKQPVTGPEIGEIRGVDSSGVLATLIDRKLITTAGRKAVVGRPILYKTTKEFLMRFGLNDVTELPSMEEFEKMTQGGAQDELFDRTPLSDATGVPDHPDDSSLFVEEESDNVASQEASLEPENIQTTGHTSENEPENAS